MLLSLQAVLACKRRHRPGRPVMYSMVMIPVDASVSSFSDSVPSRQSDLLTDDDPGVVSLLGQAIQLFGCPACARSRGLLFSSALVYRGDFPKMGVCFCKRALVVRDAGAASFVAVAYHPRLQFDGRDWAFTLPHSLCSGCAANVLALVIVRSGSSRVESGFICSLLCVRVFVRALSPPAFGMVMVWPDFVVFFCHWCMVQCACTRIRRWF